MSRWRKSQAGDSYLALIDSYLALIDSYLALITERDRKNGAGNPAQSLTEPRHAKGQKADIPNLFDHPVNSRK